MRGRMIVLMLLVFGVALTEPLSAWEPGPEEPQADEIDRTPPRLSFAEGEVSFFRPGEPDWGAARLNMPLSPGDQLSTGVDGTFELEIGPGAFVRGWTESLIEFNDQEPDMTRFKVTAGSASFDLLSLDPGQTVEVETPNAAFTIDRPGYYRADVGDDRTAFSARRGGWASAVSAGGESFGVAPEEEALIEGAGDRPVFLHPAPPKDSWDDWNRARGTYLLESPSGRYVPRGVYGGRDLDRYGHWRDEPEYGPVWVPSGMPAGWAPYSTGAWVLDPHYGWTWVDASPWGWAPFHYGRWVNLNGHWCWAPGPPAARPVYAPALVAFFGGTPAGAGFYSRSPHVGWVALGWGEPCVPWWGRPGFVHRPWWGGWRGPRLVNNRVVHRTTVVNANEIHTYRNANVRNGMVAVPEENFRRRQIHSGGFTRVDSNDLRPMHAAPRVRPPAAGPAPVKVRDDRDARDDRKNPRSWSVPHQVHKGEEKPGLIRRTPPEPLPQHRRSEGERPAEPPASADRFERRARTSPTPLPSQIEGSRKHDRRPQGEPAVRPPVPNPVAADPHQRPERRERDRPRPPVGTERPAGPPSLH